MTDSLFRRLGRQVDDNAARAVAVYQRELDDYRTLEASVGHTTMYEFAVVLRKRTVTLAATEQPFTVEDLRYMETVGEERGERGVALEAQRQVLALHSMLTLEEIRDAARPQDIDDMMRMLRWLGPQGIAAQDAYTRGYLTAQRRRLPLAHQVQRLTTMLLTDDPAAVTLAEDLSMPLPDRLLVAVVHIPDGSGQFTRRLRTETVEDLLKIHRTPMAWSAPHEFVVITQALDLTAIDGTELGGAALAVVRDFAEIAGQPLSTGAAGGGLLQLAQAAALARRISLIAPPQRWPHRLHQIADVFVELGAATVPDVDRWLNGLVDRLADGPDLLTTLDAYYQHDMNRRNTAAALHIHPRTLDYRLRRAREVSGYQPASTLGVRVLSTAVARASTAPRPHAND